MNEDPDNLKVVTICIHAKVIISPSLIILRPYNNSFGPLIAQSNGGDWLLNSCWSAKPQNNQLIYLNIECPTEH